MTRGWYPGQWTTTEGGPQLSDRALASLLRPARCSASFEKAACLGVVWPGIRVLRVGIRSRVDGAPDSVVEMAYAVHG
jgi:hypothetical protein